MGLIPMLFGAFGLLGLLVSIVTFMARDASSTYDEAKRLQEEERKRLKLKF